MTDEQTTEITPQRPDRTPLSQRDPIALAQHFAQSGYFKDADDMSKAVVKIVAGEELGIGPMAAMNGIHIIEGKPSLSANLIAGQIKKHPAYDYVIRHSDAERCEIEFFQNEDSIGTATWTIEEARRAKTYQKGKWIKLADTMRWQNSPADMLFNRCISRGARRFCPDVFSGSPIHTPEEIEESPGVADPVYVENQATPDPAEPEEVDGEIVEDPAEEPDVEETITKKRAEEIFDSAKQITEINPDSFAQAIAYIGGANDVDTTTKKAAVPVLAQLNEKQAQMLEKWIERKRPADEETTTNE